jgi:DNA-directed RNA polymerase specialized sigma24 family protein
MSDTPQSPRLDKISTSWTLLAQAHGDGDEAAAARSLLLKRYGGAVRRYLGAVLRDDAAADDVTQEFGLALVEGKLGKAAAGRGRFRDYVKAALLHLVSRHRKQQQRQPRPTAAVPEAAAAPADDAERAFLESWRAELLARTWEALAEAQVTFFTVLHFRSVHLDMPATQMAEELAVQLGKALTPAGVRQLLHRARALFADLLLVEVAQSLSDAPTRGELEAELTELNLLAYCQSALDRR